MSAVPASYEPLWLHRSLSKATLSAILRALKQFPDQQPSITHLGHAAVIVTALNSNMMFTDISMPKDLLCPLFMNGRSYLDSDLQNPKAYIPMVRAMGVLEFLNSDQYQFSRERCQAQIYSKTVLACEEARRSYQKIRDQTSMLTLSLSVAEQVATPE